MPDRVQPTLRPRARFGPRWVLGLLFAFAGYAIWARAPRHSEGVSFVRIGPEGDALNLPLGGFRCAPEHGALGTQVCERSFEGSPLRVRYTGSYSSSLRCSATYAGRAQACSPSAVHRGYPEGAVHVQADLGTSAERRRFLRMFDPLSHVAECDWALPSWLFALVFAGLCACGTCRFLDDVARWVRGVLVIASALVSAAFGMALVSVLLLWLGYID